VPLTQARQWFLVKFSGCDQSTAYNVWTSAVSHFRAGEGIVFRLAIIRIKTSREIKSFTPKSILL